MTFDEWRELHKQAPPVWFTTDEALPPPGVEVLCCRNGEPYIDKIVMVEADELGPAGMRRTRVRMWCRTIEGLHCHPVPADYYSHWASALPPEEI
jgi:hypothetical protein